MLNNIFITDIETILEVYELAKSHGKKEGDNVQAEFNEVIKRHPEKFGYLGATEMDKDLLGGNLRESGLKIINLSEINKKSNGKTL